jgi:triacylglycerol lipase
MSSRRRLLVIGIALVCAVIAGLGAFWFGPGGDGGRPASAAQDRPGPVLLVAGYGGGTGSLERLAVALRAQGRTVEVVPPVGDDTGDLRIQAQQLKVVADRAIGAGAPSVDVIGYSAGGVVTRIWAADLDGARIARRVITLGSPHHGAQVAGLAAALAPGSCPAACRQLVPGSTLLDGLREAAPGPEWVSVWSRDDTVVTPPESAQLDGAVNVELQAVCPTARVSHGELPTAPLVLGILALALGSGGLTAVPSSAACAGLGGGS